MVSGQFDVGSEHWMSEQIAYASELAEDAYAPFSERATAGANALWYAAQNQEPRLLGAAATLLEQATENVATLHRDPTVYLGARFAQAFINAHTDWAHGRDLSAESVNVTHSDILDFIDLTLEPPRLNIELKNESYHYLARAAYIGVLTRTGDPSHIIFPAPPVVQDIIPTRDTSPHNAFAAVDSALVPCEIRPHRQSASQSISGVANIFAGDALAVRLQHDLPEVSSKFDVSAPMVRAEKAVRYVADLLLRDSDGNASGQERAFLGATAENTKSYLRGRAEKFA